MYLTAFWGHKTPCSGANLKRSQAFYAGITDILKLRVLLSFLNEDPKTCTVTGLAGVLGEGKQKVSRIFMALEREGLLDRSDPRRPCLTEAGRARAACYEARTNVVLNHLLYEGLDIDSAMHDAYAWALIRSEHAFRLYTPARGQRAQLGRICGACGASSQSQRVVLHSGRFGLHLCGDVHLPWHLLYRADPDAARGM